MKHFAVHASNSTPKVAQLVLIVLLGGLAPLTGCTPRTSLKPVLVPIEAIPAQVETGPKVQHVNPANITPTENPCVRIDTKAPPYTGPMRKVEWEIHKTAAQCQPEYCGCTLGGLVRIDGYRVKGGPKPRLIAFDPPVYGYAQCCSLGIRRVDMVKGTVIMRAEQELSPNMEQP